jgi:competence protein ComEC
MTPNRKSEIQDPDQNKNSTTKIQNAVLLRPCLPLVLALMTGLILGTQLYDSNLQISPWVLLFLLLAFPVVILFFPSFAVWTGCGFFIVTGLSLVTFLSPQAAIPPVPFSLVNHELQHLSGVILEEPDYYPERTRLVIRLTSYTSQGQNRSAQGIILLGIKGLIKGFNQGDPVRFVCRLRWIEGYHNPGGFDFEKKMARKGIQVSGFIEDPELLILNGPNQRSWPWQQLSVLRKQVSDLIDSRSPPPFNGLAQALLTGDQSKIPREIQQVFGQAGVSHLLAFSGLNLTLVGGLSYYLFRFVLSLSETILLNINVRKWALIGTFFPVLGYTLLAGMSPSAARAFFMVGMVITALLLNKYSDLLNSLALAALIILLLSPDSLFLPSFQLSFLAVWAIGYLLPRILNPDSGWSRGKASLFRRLAFYLWGTFCVSLVCQLATSPIVAWWFHQISLIGLISNLILVPLSGILATPIGLLALIFAPIFSPLSSLLFWIMDLMLQWTLGLTRFFADLPYAFIILPRPGYGEIAFFYLTLVLVFNFRKIPKPVWSISLSCLGMILFFFSPQIRDFFSPPFRVTFLDVGHGSSTLIEFPRGQKMLIDGGGSFNPEFDLGERVIAPFLWKKKITGLDVVVLTHPHPDHLNGLPYILSKFKVKEIWTNGHWADSEPFRRFEELIRQKKIPIIYPVPGWFRSFSNVRVEVLQASGEITPKGALPASIWHNQNNGSLVLRLTYKNEQVLLPADIEDETEKCLLVGNNSLRSSILQVPHHGSRTSSSTPFIEAVHPRYAVISGRASSRFPLPHPDVIRRYLERGVTLFRTDQEGAMTFELKKEGWEVRSFLKGALIGKPSENSVAGSQKQ